MFRFFEQAPISLTHITMPLPSSYQISILCAEWCGVCREFSEHLQAFSSKRTEFQISWIDIEESPEWDDRVEVENFPTLYIENGNGEVVFSGSIEPDPAQFERLLDAICR